MTKAQILNADAMGPKVPATRGKAVLVNHHRLQACIVSNLNVERVDE